MLEFYFQGLEMLAPRKTLKTLESLWGRLQKESYRLRLRRFGHKHHQRNDQKGAEENAQSFVVLGA